MKRNKRAQMEKIKPKKNNINRKKSREGQSKDIKKRKKRRMIHKKGKD